MDNQPRRLRRVNTKTCDLYTIRQGRLEAVFHQYLSPRLGRLIMSAKPSSDPEPG
jgi:hypothetical protein